MGLEWGEIGNRFKHKILEVNYEKNSYTYSDRMSALFLFD